MSKKVFVIINPVSGKPEPILHTLNKIFTSTNIQWDVGITSPNNLNQLIQRANEFKADILAVYGGDGTISAVCKENDHPERPFAILPGGTANVLSQDLSIPQNLEEACKLLVSKDSIIRTIDCAQANDTFFFTRLGWGLEAKMIENTSREMKNKVGNFAYAISAIKALFKSDKLKFQLNIDGKKIKKNGSACIIANSGNLGKANLHIHPVVIDDGLLDVFIFRDSNIEALIGTAANVLSQAEIPGIDHWQGKNIEISCKPQTTVQCDGEVMGKENVKISILEKSSKFITPKVVE